MQSGYRQPSCNAHKQLARKVIVFLKLAAHAGTPLSRGEIFDRLWAGDSRSENVVDVYIGYLRRKLKPSADFGFDIITLRQQGFCLEGTPPIR